MTKVVNVRVKNIKPKYNNLKEWMQKKNHIYIGRKGIVFIDNKRFPSKDSIWCNPFKITPTQTREVVLRKYEKYIINKIKKEHLVTELLKLRGKKLGCWCYPEKCHGDVLIKLINYYYRKLNKDK